MCIAGLVRLFELTKDKSYLESALAAGEWLLKMQREDGSFYAMALPGEGLMWNRHEASVEDIF